VLLVFFFSFFLFLSFLSTPLFLSYFENWKTSCNIFLRNNF